MDVAKSRKATNRRPKCQWVFGHFPTRDLRISALFLQPLQLGEPQEVGGQKPPELRLQRCKESVKRSGGVLTGTFDMGSDSEGIVVRTLAGAAALCR
jgi:hypothetical protein